MISGSNKNIILAVSKFPERAASSCKPLFLSLNLKTFLIALLLLLFYHNVVFTQSNDFSVSIKGNFTGTSRYYPSGGTSGVYSYDNYYSIDDLFGYGLELRYNYSENLKFGLSGELVSGATQYTHKTFRIPAKTGYTMYIVETDGYYYIPLSGENFKFYIGGGINLSMGSNYEELANIKSENISSPIDIGIQALSGLEFFFKESFSVRWEIKFRDPVVENESKYTASKVEYEGRTYNVSTKPFKSKINIDGIIFDLSIAYHFF